MQTKEELKLCVNCKHHILNCGIHQCARDIRIDLVTGKERYKDCFMERAASDSARVSECGKGGFYYEPRTEPQE